MDQLTLINSLSEKSAITVAAIFGVTRRTIYRWCKKYDVPRRVYRCPDHALLCRLEADCVLQKQIAMIFGVSRWTIRLWCKKYALAHHTTGKFRKGSNRNTPAIHEEMPFGIGVMFSDDFD